MFNFIGSPAPPRRLTTRQLTDINCANQIILELQWLAPGAADNTLLYQVEVSSRPDEYLYRSLVRDTIDHVVLNHTAGEELYISVRTCDRCGDMSNESANVTMTVQGKSVLSIIAVGNA